MQGLKRSGIVVLLTLGAIGVAGAIAAHTVLDTRALRKDDGSWEDIYYAWREGQRITQGVNPYGFVLEGDTHENAGFYATYFPLFYLLSAATQKLGLSDFDRWVSFWRLVFLLCDVAIAILLFHALHRDGRGVLGVFAMGFWLFNRWTLRVVAIAHLDFPPLLLLLASLMLIRKRPIVSCLLFGVSLALKQIAIFTAPLYLVWLWQSRPERRAVRTLVGLLAAAAVPVAASIPFLIWNAKAYLVSVFFSVTRSAADHFSAPSLDAMLRDHGVAVEGIAARLPLLVLMLLIYVAAARRKVGVYTSVLLVMSTFLCFNPVLFRQYIVWALPFTPLCALDGEGRDVSPRVTPAS